MDDSGWKPFCSNNQSFIVRRCFSITNFKVQLSDHRRLWSAEGTASELLHLSQKENPLCEFDLTKVTKNIFNLFDTSLELLSVDGDGINYKNLTMSASLGLRPFCLVWTLLDQGPDELYEEVTRPLLLFTEEMGQRQNYLFRLLVEKDKEIDEYVLENNKPLLGMTKTEKFKEGNLNNEFVKIIDDTDPIKSVWRQSNLLVIFNKYLFRDTKREKVRVKEEIPEQQNEINAKQEGTVSQNACVVQPKLKVTQMKNENPDELSKSRNIQSKRKKVKLNL